MPSLSRLVVIGGLGLLGVVGASAVHQWINPQTYEVVVTDKERVVERSGDSTTSRYLVFTRDFQDEVRVFENKDMWSRGKFRSSDLQGMLESGNCYAIDTNGFRFGFLSWYPNIREAERINCPPGQ